jgi:insertion element IS1 protein InsB
VDKSVNSKAVQTIVDSVPAFEKNYTDGGGVYLDIVFGGAHKRNVHNKNDTYTIEGTNADLRHYIAGLRRKSRCFFRSFETLKAVLLLFITAYNKFGEWKQNYRERHPKCGRDFSFSHVNFI